MGPRFSPQRIKLLQFVLLAQILAGAAVLITGVIKLNTVTGSEQTELRQDFISLFVVPAVLLIALGLVLYRSVPRGATRPMLAGDGATCFLLSPLLITNWVGWVLPVVALLLMVLTLVPEGDPETRRGA